TIEEILEVALSLAALALILIVVIWIVAARVLGIWLNAVVRIGQQTAATLVAGVFRQCLRVDVYHGWADRLSNFDKRVGFCGGVRHFERRGVAAITRSFLAAHSMSCVGTADDDGGQNGEKKECRSEALRAQSCIERIHRFED